LGEGQQQQLDLAHVPRRAQLARLRRLEVEIHQHVAVLSRRLGIVLRVESVLDPPHDHLGIVANSAQTTDKVLPSLKDDELPENVHQQGIILLDSEVRVNS
jgi:hypothetical protein